MISFATLLHVCAVILMGGLSTFALDKYTAAVYEHSVILADNILCPVSSEEALKLMNKNMDILEEAIKTAAKQVLIITL